MENNRENLLKAACFLGGVVVGFLISPIKRGINIGNHSGNTVLAKEELDDDEEKDENENVEEVSKEEEK